MERINRQFRKLLYEKAKKQGIIDIYFPRHLKDVSKEEQIKYILYESVAFMDLYKNMHYKVITNTLKEMDLEILPIVDAIISFEEIHECLCYNKHFLSMLANAPIEFYNATILEKIAQVKSMGSEDKNFLEEITPNFKEDIEFYDKQVSLETYYTYFINLQKKYEKQGINIMPETIIAQIESFIKQLYSWDFKNCINNILELAFIDYIYSLKYLQEKEYPDVANGKQKAIKRTKIYEETTEEELINQALIDEYYLFEIIDTYLYSREFHKSLESYQKEVETLTKDTNCQVKEKIKKQTERWEK
jgi:hypothetical protein